MQYNELVTVTDGLFYAVLLVTVLFMFQKAVINNNLISKDCLCDFML